MSLSHLNVAELPLTGRHLIEASAGTGKTFNITRIYLRFLLEMRLPVQQILVMTFTKAATEEIRGRIAATLREALAFWQVANQQGLPEKADPVMASVYRAVPGEEGIALLQAALLELDDAAVFTIHSFCNRVLGDMAFTSATPLELALATDTRELYRLACEDFFRKISHDESAFILLQQQNWHSPERFIRRFGNLFDSSGDLGCTDTQTINQEFAEQLKSVSASYSEEGAQLCQSLLTQAGLFHETVIQNKPERAQEWDIILNWLEGGDFSTVPREVGQFVNGNRFRAKREGMEEAKAAIEPLKDFRLRLEKSLKQVNEAHNKQLNKAPALQVVLQAITFIREHVAKQKAQLQHVDFNDLIRMLAQRITSPDSSLSVQLRSQYPVALVDEFQDTDADQYHILANVYSSEATEQGKHALLMIGDPKQAIYGFRGGDIFTYLAAARQAKYRWVMDTNWRSVAPMVNAYNRLFWGNSLNQARRDLFDFEIGYEPVNASPGAKAASVPLSDPKADRAALTFLLLPQDDEQTDSPPTGPKTAPPRGEVRIEQAELLTREILRLLSEVTLGNKLTQPGDIAILVKNGNEARVVQQSLSHHGLPSVYLSNRNSLFESAEAVDVLRVLDAIWQAHDMRLVQSALSSPLIGLPTTKVHELLQNDDAADWDALLTQLSEWRAIWQRQGVLSMLLGLLQHQYRPPETGAERSLTNYQHLAEVLQDAAKGYPQPGHHLNWLRRQVLDPGQAQELVQRLESDARLIQIVTQHGSKGLEYPIVFVPFASEYRDPTRFGNTLVDVVRYYDESEGKQQQILGPGPQLLERVKREADAESMRLLYVAITRSSHRCYLGVAETLQSELSSLGKVLARAQFTSWEAAIQALVNEGEGHTACISSVDNRDLTLPPEPAVSLACQRFERALDDPWRLYSFSALTRQVAHTRIRQRESEINEVTAPDPVVSPEQSELLRYTLRPGAQSGNLLHDMLEELDFSEPDWLETAPVIAQRYGIDAHEQPALFEWLEDVLDTPLQDVFQGDSFSMSSLPLHDTLREAEFYFPLNAVKRHALSKALAEHRAAVLEQPLPVNLEGSALAGMMHGFIDLIFKRGDRYYVADYKSTYLGVGEHHYQPDNLALNNMQHNYDLQYLIYSVALHRFLAKRIPDYDPEVHFGGVYYFYLRGMSTQHSEHSGVFYHQLPVSTVLAVEKALTGSQTLVKAVSNTGSAM